MIFVLIGAVWAALIVLLLGLLKAASKPAPKFDDPNDCPRWCANPYPHRHVS